MQESCAASVDRPLAQVARKLLREQFRRFQRYLRRCEKHPERPERVHRLRIATRRMDAAMATLSPLLPRRRSRRLRRTIRDVRRAARSVRDLDVLIARLSDTEQPEITAVLKKQRKAAAKNLAQSIHIVTAADLDRRFDRILNRVRWRDGQAPGDRERLVPVLLEPTLQRFFHAAQQDLGQIEQLHSFRLQGKRTRYSLELLEDFCGDQPLHSLQDLTLRLQQELGDINDHATAIAIYSGLDECELAALIDEEQRRLAAQHAAFLEWWESSGRGDTETAIVAVLGPHA